MTSLMRRNRFEELISSFPKEWFNWERSGTLAMEWSPRCDVTETEATVTVHAELPGVSAEELEVVVDDGVLTIRGEKTSERTEERDNRTYRERFFGSFERSIAVPAGVDESSIKAQLKDGVLEVTMARSPVVKPSPRKIEISHN